MMKILRTILVIVIILAGVFLRIGYFDQKGKDIRTYKRAIIELLDGKNPYTHTIESYKNDRDPWNHGFAYLPGQLYLNAPLYLLHTQTNLLLEVLWKIPTLIADVLISLFLFKMLRKKSFYAAILGMSVWLFNPYLIAQKNYTFFDPPAIFLMLTSLYFCKKDDVLSGTLFALSVAFKTFPIILFPILFLKSKNKLKFLISGALIAVLISIPFMGTVDNFKTYLNGSLFVHGNRAMQGRPFLFYISYYYNIEFFQIIPIKVYTYLAILLAMLIPTFLILAKYLENKYVLSLISFLIFYALTPVLNRTYLLWFLPIFVIAIYHIFEKRKLYYYTTLGSYYAFYYWYLKQWVDGFHIKHP